MYLSRTYLTILSDPPSQVVSDPPSQVDSNKNGGRSRWYVLYLGGGLCVICMIHTLSIKMAGREVEYLKSLLHSYLPFLQRIQYSSNLKRIFRLKY